MRTRIVAGAAAAFLGTLDAEQKAKAALPFPEQRQATAVAFQGGKDGRMRFVGEAFGPSIWSNFPASDVPRAGLALGAMTPVQSAAAMRLLQALLSPGGYGKVRAIMDCDQVLSDAGTAFAAGTAFYSLAILGEPQDRQPWLVQFGAHHLGLNVLIAGERAGMMPILTGAQPTRHGTGSGAMRVLGEENDKAFALLSALSEDQRRQAVVGERAIDLLLGPGHDRETAPTEGLAGASLDAVQRGMLLDLVAEWVGIVHDAYARPRMTEIEAGLDDTRFVWRGPVTREPNRNGTAYFRIQGPTFVIEFAPQPVGGDPTLHVHTIYRSPKVDYGRALIAG